MTDKDGGPACPPHDWEAVSGWGVLIGVSRCRCCGKPSVMDDFPAAQRTALAERDKDADALIQAEAEDEPAS